MKIDNKLFLAISSCLTLLFFQCSSGKYYPDFKVAQKKADTIAFVSPFIFVKSVQDETQTEDKVSENTIQKQISEKSHSLLADKHFLSDFNVSMDSTLGKTFIDLFAQVDSQGKQLTLINTPTYIQRILKNSNQRYCLTIFFAGSYNAYFKPYENLKTNAIYFNRHLFKSDIKIIIFDCEKNNIVYYNKKDNTNDPRIKDFIYQITTDVLKQIYYK